MSGSCRALGFCGTESNPTLSFKPDKKEYIEDSIRISLNRKENIQDSIKKISHNLNYF